MFQLVQRRRWYAIFSGTIIFVGIALMIYSTILIGTPFRLSIDFVGGSIYELDFEDTITEGELRDVFSAYGEDNVIIQQVGDAAENRWSVRSGFLEADDSTALLNDLDEQAGLDFETLFVEQVSPTIGGEVTRAAFFAVITASIVITGFIVIAFRQVPNALRYGLCAISAMVHDVLVMMGTMALLGLVLNWEVDALFLTAVLTVVGFSVQDSIVVFDRIRENIPKHLGEPYETIVNRSILETIHRSLATQLNAFFVMIAILLFGGDTVRQFIFILLIGLLSGTYSSIFVAVPLLVAWEKGELPFIPGSVGTPVAAAEA